MRPLPGAKTHKHRKESQNKAHSKKEQLSFLTLWVFCSILAAPLDAQRLHHKSVTFSLAREGVFGVEFAGLSVDYYTLSAEGRTLHPRLHRDKVGCSSLRDLRGKEARFLRL